MTRPILSFVLIAAASFALGYVVRGFVQPEPVTTAAAEHAAKTAVDSAGEAAPEQIEVLPDSPYVSADDQMIDEPLAEQATLSASAANPGWFGREEMQDRMIEAMKKRYAEFFLLQGIGPARADEILQSLINPNLNRIEDTNLRRLLRAAQRPDATDAEKSAATEAVRLRQAESELAQQAILGEYYEAFNAYNKSLPQRQLVNSFSESLPEPLYSSTKDELLRIVTEESATLADVQRSVSFETYDKEHMLDQRRVRLESRRSINERIKERAQPYLTADQFGAFVQSMDIEVERAEAMLRLQELSPDR